jgi:hypothetical protein
MRLVGLAVLLLGCGDNVTGLPLSELDGAADRARCERLVRCGVFVDANACDGFFRKRPDTDLAAAIAAGLVVYNGPAAEQCFEALANQSCDASSRDARTVPATCADMFIGTLGTGEPCALDEECKSGTCLVPACPELCCPGTCHKARAAIGGACELDVDCGSEAFCGSDSACHPHALEGELCDRDVDCDYGLACIGPSDLMPGNCRKQPLLGEPCLYQRCAEIGAMCVSGTCIAVGLPGAPCTKPSDCSSGALCDSASGTCIALPRLGEPCTSLCAGEAWCDVFDTSTCRAPQEDNAPCTSNDQCASLFCAEGVVFDFCATLEQCI